MVPNKPNSKKPPKADLKPIEKPISKSKRLKKKNYQNYSIYIYKLLKLVTQEKIGISRKAMTIMNDLVYDVMEKLSTEAGALVTHSKKQTLSSQEVQSAVKLVVPGELAKHANMDSLKAITLYHNSQDS